MDNSSKILKCLTGGVFRPISEIASLTRIGSIKTKKIIGDMVHNGSVQRFRIDGYHYYNLTNSDNNESKYSNYLGDFFEIKGQLKLARVCHGHAAGKLGVFICRALLSQGLVIEKNSQFISEGFKLGGCSIDKLVSGKKCLDGTERLYHIGGKLGSNILNILIKLKWAKRSSGRCLNVSKEGLMEIKKLYH